MTQIRDVIGYLSRQDGAILLAWDFLLYPATGVLAG